MTQDSRQARTNETGRTNDVPAIGTARYQTDESLAREAAAFELVGTVGALLLNGERLPDGTLRIDLSGPVLAGVVDTFNRATANGPITLPER